ncbi:MAG: leucyl aminopeptidase [Candidatus Dormiibacter spiritus]|nr:MAG: leucyl aminopeptidase [Candidatus Dormibacteraeota bacterium]
MSTFKSGHNDAQVSLIEGARIIVNVCASVQAGEDVLVVTDKATSLSIAQNLASAAEEKGASAAIAVVQAQRTGTEPVRPVAAAMQAANVVIAATSASLYHTDAARNAVAGGARLLSMTEISEEVMTSGAITADFEAQGPIIESVRALLTSARAVRVTAPGGTSLDMSLEGREAMQITALARTPGTRSATPDLEAFIAPVEGTAEGVLVVDGSASNLGLIRTPVMMEISGGRVTSISGGQEADRISANLREANHEGAYVIAELGIGLNPNGLVRGHIIEDEGAYGTAHVALGNNTNFTGGKNWAPVHFDHVFHRPTITLDGVEVMVDGVLTEAARPGRG